MTYSEKLILIKETYPFDKWRIDVYPHGEDESIFTPEQYECGLILREICNKIQKIMDIFIAKLIEVGEDASPKVKEKIFEIIIKVINQVNNSYKYSLLDTNEREDLCELFSIICETVGLDENKNYNGDITGNWRDW